MVVAERLEKPVIRRRCSLRTRDITAARTEKFCFPTASVPKDKLLASVQMMRRAIIDMPMAQIVAQPKPRFYQPDPAKDE